MVNLALEHIEKTKSRIYIQSTGAAHILDINYRQSLHNLFSLKGCAVLSVIPDGKESAAKEDLADGIPLEKTNILNPKGLCDEAYTLELHRPFSAFKNMKKERKLEKRVRENSGDIFTP